VSPAVSIILPTFTRLKYLPATVDSVFAQTFQDWELIIADDGSDAQTRECLQAVASRPRTMATTLIMANQYSIEPKLWTEHELNRAACRRSPPTTATPACPETRRSCTRRPRPPRRLWQ
jgi:glycosyltransferase involved in cell wall biosynthesis